MYGFIPVSIVRMVALFSVIGGEDCNDDPYDNGPNIGQPQIGMKIRIVTHKETNLMKVHYELAISRSYVLNFTDCDDESICLENADEICDGLDMIAMMKLMKKVLEVYKHFILIMMEMVLGAPIFHWRLVRLRKDTLNDKK